MAIKMVRQPSETPNINNIDDFIPFRYAYGNQDGYVIGKGTEFDKEIIGNTFRIKSGRAVIQGVEIEIDANGYDVIIDPIQEKRYYLIYFEVDLSTMSVSIKTMYDNNGYPVDLGQNDDLTENSSGIAKLLIYAIETYNGVVEASHKQIKAIDYTGKALVGYDSSKGTVEERLTALGFREGSVILGENITATQNVLKRQGNYVLGHLILDVSKLSDDGDYATPSQTVFTLPDNFKIIDNYRDNLQLFEIPFEEGYAWMSDRFAGKFYQKSQTGEDANKFKLSWVLKDASAGDTHLEIMFGYEAIPLKTKRG